MAEGEEKKLGKGEVLRGRRTYEILCTHSETISLARKCVSFVEPKNKVFFCFKIRGLLESSVAFGYSMKNSVHSSFPLSKK